MQEMNVNSGYSSPSEMSNMMKSNSQMAVNPSNSQSMNTAVTYPEIYYKLQPYIMLVSDSLASLGKNPTQDELDMISDSIYDDICRRDPDLKAYLEKYETNDPPANDPPLSGFRGGSRPGFGFRRRGLGRDFIDALLLASLFGRRIPFLPFRVF